MNPQEQAALQEAAGHCEISLKAFQAVLAGTYSQALSQAAADLLQVLRHLHDIDPALLSPEARDRVDLVIQGEKKRSGRDSFNTGF